MMHFILAHIKQLTVPYEQTDGYFEMTPIIHLVVHTCLGSR